VDSTHSAPTDDLYCLCFLFLGDFTRFALTDNLHHLCSLLLDDSYCSASSSDFYGLTAFVSLFLDNSTCSIPTKDLYCLRSLCSKPKCLLCHLEGQSGRKYFVTFVDDKSRAPWVYLLNKKSEVFGSFKKFYCLVHTQYNKRIKVLRTDNSKENVNDSFDIFTKDEGYRTPNHLPKNTPTGGSE
ncbi:Retrovirus-related Pol polyprotein from transposon TNT 1-94, partial [Nymphaea thermarum]